MNMMMYCVHDHTKFERHAKWIESKGKDGFRLRISCRDYHDQINHKNWRELLKIQFLKHLAYYDIKLSDEEINNVGILEINKDGICINEPYTAEVAEQISREKKLVKPPFKVTYVYCDTSTDELAYNSQNNIGRADHHDLYKDLGKEVEHLVTSLINDYDQGYVEQYDPSGKFEKIMTKLNKSSDKETIWMNFELKIEMKRGN